MRPGSDRPDGPMVLPDEVRAAVPDLHRRLAASLGDPADAAAQGRILAVLDGVPAWRRWTARLRPLGLRPLWIGPGLEIASDTQAARRLLVGLAASLVPGGLVPPFTVGGAAVTEVTARGGTALSHSQNDLPAPPHTAGFFEPVPPMANLFACVRPHPGGGAETTVTDVARLLSRAHAESARRWAGGAYRFRTSARLGGGRHPLRILRRVSGLPFLRYRYEYTEAEGPERRALEALRAAVADPANTLAYPLRRDEVLVVWNGAPHGRLPQIGPTPADPRSRRLLLRCRVSPRSGWADRFVES
jgi:hypothetical protein